jgi:hypothetical protein
MFFKCSMFKVQCSHLNDHLGRNAQYSIFNAQYSVKESSTIVKLPSTVFSGLSDPGLPDLKCQTQLCLHTV